VRYFGIKMAGNKLRIKLMGNNFIFSHKPVLGKTNTGTANIKYNKQLYDKYYKNEFGNVSEMIYAYLHQDTWQKEKICLVCGKPTRFECLSRGYHKFCSRKCASKYDVINNIGFHSNESKLKISSHKKESIEKRKLTLLKRYGVTCSYQINNIMEKSKIASKTPEAIKKRMESDKKNHGGRLAWDSEKSIKSRFETAKKNGTINKSKLEDISYELLYKIYPDIIRQYKDIKRYPYFCDFYIPSKDLFIEMHLGLNHQGCEYDPNNEEHKKKVIYYKEKAEQNHPRYNKIILEWTITDPKKLKSFKDNNCNFKIFYNMEEFYKWYNELKCGKMQYKN